MGDDNGSVFIISGPAKNDFNLRCRQKFNLKHKQTKSR